VDGKGVLIRTTNRKLAAQCLLLSAGAWTDLLFGGLSLPLAVERQVMFWFQPLGSDESFAPSQCPIFICEYDPGKFFYGLPDTGHGVKVAFHHEGESTDPDQVRRQVDENEVQRMRQTLTRFLPLANGPLKSTTVCMYTNTPDEHFLFDRHPDHPQVWIASACSGHGFKFSPVLGEMAAASVQGLEPAFDLSLFKLGRFQSQ
jgi:sarcosine oxidase